MTGLHLLKGQGLGQGCLRSLHARGHAFRWVREHRGCRPSFCVCKFYSSSLWAQELICKMAEAWVLEGPKLCMQAGMQVGESTKVRKYGA